MTKSQTDQIAAKTQTSATEVINDDGYSGCNSTSLFPLRHVAESLPGEVETMVTLASLSRDDRVRAVADLWTSLSRKAKQTVEFEQLCRVIGIDGGHFVSAITAIAFELGMDVSRFIGSLECWTVQVPTSQQRAMAAKGYAMREQFFKAAAFWAGTTSGLVCEPVSLAIAFGRRGVSKRIDRGHRVLSLEGRRSCDKMAAFRRKVSLSQRQFARLFVAAARTVQRWEAREFSPSPHQEWLLGVLVRYVNEKGITAFQERFVQQPPRFQKRGRPVFKAPQRPIGTDTGQNYLQATNPQTWGIHFATKLTS
jgi:DNA-binding transcriptional regulator YiaG